MTEIKETTRISQRAYCRAIKAPLDKEEIFLRWVQMEDEINHRDGYGVTIPAGLQVKRTPKGWARTVRDFIISVKAGVKHGVLQFRP